MMRGCATQMQWGVIDGDERWHVTATFDRSLAVGGGLSLRPSSLPFAADEGDTIKVSVVAADSTLVDETSATITRRRVE